MTSEQLILFTGLIITVVGGSIILFRAVTAKNRRVKIINLATIGLAVMPFFLAFFLSLMTYDGFCTWKRPVPCPFGEYLVYPFSGLGLFTIGSILWYSLVVVIWWVVWLFRRLFRRAAPGNSA